MKTIIFLHGGPGFKDYLKYYFEGRFEKFKCLFYDQEQGPVVKMDTLITQLNNIVDSVDGMPLLFGHSWGGVLGTEYVKRYPDKIGSLVLVATGLSAKQWLEFQDELVKKGLEDIEKEDLFFTASEKAIKSNVFEGIPEDSFSDETFDSLNEDYLKSYNLLDDLTNIKTPILNIYGEQDKRFPKCVTTKFKDYNESIINLEVKDSGHFPFFLEENRKLIIATTSDFLNESK